MLLQVLLKKKKIGEIHNPETHLIPIYSLILNKKNFKIYGNNYPTKDGTCLRDYIHILDIIRGIEKSSKLFVKNTKSDIFNLGSGKVYSCKEIIKICIQYNKMQNKKINYQENRKHDSAKLVCSIKKAEKFLDGNLIIQISKKLLKMKSGGIIILRKRDIPKIYILMKKKIKVVGDIMLDKWCEGKFS